MTNRRVELVIAAVFFAIGAVVLVNVWQTPQVPVEDPLGPYGLPRAIAIGLVLIAVLLGAEAWWGAVRGPAPADAESDAGVEPTPSAVPELSAVPAADAVPSAGAVPAAAGVPAGTSPIGDGVVADAAVGTVDGAPEDISPQRRRALGALTMAATIGYVLLLPTLGFVIASILLGVVLLPVLGSRNLRVVAGVPAAAVAPLWLLFVYTLDVNLPTFLGR